MARFIIVLAGVGAWRFAESPSWTHAEERSMQRAACARARAVH